MNQILENKILLMIAQCYAVDYTILNNIYTEVQSFDKIISIVDIMNKRNLDLSNAYENWKITV